MSDQTFCGRHYLTGHAMIARVADGQIVGLDRVPDCPDDRWLAPGLVDVQVNGYAGVDFQRDGITAEGLLSASLGLARDGCGRWMLTLITAEWSELIQRLKHLKAIRDNVAELRSAIVGWHVEGPFLSAELGYRGAHDAGVMRDPSVSAIEELCAAVDGDPLMLTLAPERPGSEAAIRRAAELGICVSLGHSNATAEELAMATAAGARGFTHLGNGMPQAMDRHDNIVGRVLDGVELTVGLIPDQIHVSPQLFRLIHRVLPQDRIYCTTDAMAAAGAPPGRYTIGKIELEVGADEIVRMPGASNFAGSALRPLEGVRRAARMLGVTWRDVWDCFSINPARLIGVSCGLEPGAEGGVMLMTTDGHLVEGH